MRIPAITSLGMDDGLALGYDLLLKCMWIVGLDVLDGRMNIVVVKAVIFAVRTCTTFALLSRSKTVTIHLKASAFFALASNLV